jgi:hypothetical protein
MPRAVERALRRRGRKKGYSGERLEEFVYSIMTDMQKKGKIRPWRKLKKH